MREHSRRGWRWHTPPIGSPVRLRLDLQRRQRYNLRRHVQRAATRFVVLVGADLGSFAVMRAFIRSIRDPGVFGPWLSDLAQSVTPPGVLNGWQYASALFVSLLLLGCYGAGDQRRDSRRLFMAAALATALPLWMLIWIRGPSVVAVEYAVTTLLVWAGVLGERLLVDRIVGRVRPREESAARTLFVGTARECASVVGMPAFQTRRDYRSVGFVDVDLPLAAGALGHVVEVARVIHDSRAETVVMCGQLTDGQVEDVASAALASGCQLLKLPRGVNLPGVQPGVVWRNGQPLIELTAPTLRGWQLVLKRGIDVLGSILGLTLLSPVFAYVMLRIRLDSPGSVIFHQDRIGREGRLFRILKFRTMAVDAEQRREGLLPQSIYADQRLFKVPGDPRITRVGRWLRRTSLDELPQLVNVLKGEMSLVGPRPPLPCEVELYEAHHYARFDVKPGMTGPWQVAGRNEVTDFESIVDLETAYIRNWTVLADLIILARTVPAVLRMRGAH